MLTRSDVFRIVEKAKAPLSGVTLHSTRMAQADDAFELIRLIALKIEQEYSGLPGQPETMTVMDWLMPSYPLLDADSLTVEEGGNVSAVDLSAASLESEEAATARINELGNVLIDARKVRFDKPDNYRLGPPSTPEICYCMECKIGRGEEC